VDELGGIRIGVGGIPDAPVRRRSAGAAHRAKSCRKPQAGPSNRHRLLGYDRRRVCGPWARAGAAEALVLLEQGRQPVFSNVGLGPRAIFPRRPGSKPDFPAQVDDAPGSGRGRERRSQPRGTGPAELRARAQVRPAHDKRRAVGSGGQREGPRFRTSSGPRARPTTCPAFSQDGGQRRHQQRRRCPLSRHQPCCAAASRTRPPTSRGGPSFRSMVRSRERQEPGLERPRPRRGPCARARCRKPWTTSAGLACARAGSPARGKAEIGMEHLGLRRRWRCPRGYSLRAWRDGAG